MGAEAAYDVGTGCGERISLALRDALFEDGHLRIAPDHEAFEAFVAAAAGDATSPG